MDKILGSKYAKDICVIAITALMTLSCNQKKCGENMGEDASADSSCIKEQKTEDAVSVVRKAIPFTGDFSQITNMGSPNIVFTEGECSIVAEGPEVLVNHVRVSVDSGSLIVTLNSENNQDMNLFGMTADKLTLYISAPELRIVSTCSSGSFTAKGKVETEDFIVGTLGAGSIEFDTLVCSKSFRYEGKSVADAIFRHIDVTGQAELLGDGSGDIEADMNVNGQLLLNLNGTGTTNVSGTADGTEILSFNKSVCNVNMKVDGLLSVSSYDNSSVTFSGTYKTKQIHRNSESTVTIN